MNSPSTIYLKHRDGGTHALSGRKLAKLAKAVKNNTAQPEIVALVEAGYEDWFTGTMEGGIEEVYRAFEA